jgi:hypothetical protein
MKMNLVVSKCKKLLIHLHRKLYFPNVVFASAYADMYGPKWRPVYEETRVSGSKPRGFGSINVDLRKKLDHTLPIAGVLELDDPYVLKNCGWVMDKNRNFLPEFSWFGKHIDEINFIPWILPNGRILKGTTVSLASDFAVGSYGHFFYDVISRLHLFYEAGFSIEDVDYILCPKPTQGNAEYLFNQLGLPKEKLVWIDNETLLRPEILLATSFPGARRNYPKWVSMFIQKTFLQNVKKPPKRRLFVTRKGYKRNPINLEEVEKSVTKFGFEIYDPVAQIKSHLDFHEAEAVVGGSGSNLTGLIFCQPGTKVLELISEDHVYPYYYSICESAGLEFSYLTCKSSGFRGQDAWGPSHSDYYVDIKELEEALSSILEDNV